MNQLADLHAMRLRNETPTQLPFKATYEVWDTDLGYWRTCEFFLFAFDRVEAKRLAVKCCRDNNGQPIDYYNLEVQQHEKGK